MREGVTKRTVSAAADEPELAAATYGHPDVREVSHATADVRPGSRR